jgi:uncharacterized RDD family membrane protein YckC
MGVFVSEKTIDFKAGFWIRVVSNMIDMVCMLVLSGVINMALGLSFFSLQPKAPTANDGWSAMFSLVAGFLYFSIAQGYFSGTIGKKALGLALVDAKTFKKVSIGQSVGRYFMMFVSSFCFGLGLMAVGWNKNKQGWHDSVAGTRVIKKKEFSQHRARLKKQAAAAVVKQAA